MVRRNLNLAILCLYEFLYYQLHNYSLSHNSILLNSSVYTIQVLYDLSVCILTVEYFFLDVHTLNGDFPFGVGILGRDVL